MLGVKIGSGSGSSLFLMLAQEVPQCLSQILKHNSIATFEPSTPLGCRRAMPPVWIVRQMTRIFEVGDLAFGSAVDRFDSNVSH